MVFTRNMRPWLIDSTKNRPSETKASKGLAGHFRKTGGQVDPAGPQPEMILIGLCTHTSPQCVPEDLNFLSFKNSDGVEKPFRGFVTRILIYNQIEES